MRSLFFSIFGAFIISASVLQVAIAQTSGGAEIIPPGAILVANVGIHDAKIISKEGNKVTFSFTLSNEGEQQSGVKYGARLVKQELVNGIVKQSVVHEQIFDETLTLTSGARVSKTATYIAPENVNGIYTLNITSKNTKGFPFGEQVIGEVLFESQAKGVTLLPETCLVATKNNPTPTTLPLSLFVANLGAEDTLQVTCTFVNNSESEISLTPTYKTYEGSLYGSVVPAEGGTTEETVFVPNGESTRTFTLPKAAKPGKYVVVLGFGAENTNTISLNYIIEGKSASISNSTLDKNSYKKGETAVLKVLWASTEQSLTAKVSTRGVFFACASDVSSTLTRNSENPFSVIEIPIKRKCVNPKVTVQLIDSEGTKLDEQTVLFASEGGMKNRTTKIAIAIVAILGVITIAASVLKRKNQNHTA